MFGVSGDITRDQSDDYLRTWPIFNEDGSPSDLADLPSATALRTGKPVTKVISVKRPRGPRLWLECSATLLRSDGDGSITGVVTSIRDLSDRRDAEQSLRFRSHLLDAVGQAVIANDATGRVVYWNSAAERTFGWSALEALGQPVTDMVQIDTEQAADIVEAVASGETWTGAVSVRRRDGSAFRALASDTPVVDDAGQLVAIIGVVTDVTSLYEINESMRLQSALLSAVGQSIVATDVNDRVVYWNPAAAHEFGWTEEEILGKEASATLAHETRLDLARELEEKRREGEEWTGDLLMKRKDGSVFTASVSTSPVRDETGEVVKFIAVMVDVTERREAEEAASHIGDRGVHR